MNAMTIREAVAIFDNAEKLEAARLAKDPPPDLVISDFMMPVLDGARFLHAMQGTEAHRNIPRIIMSSVPEPSVRRHIDGYAGFIRKPFKLMDMVQLVERVLDTKRQAQP